MTDLHPERAVVGPQIDRARDGAHTALVDELGGLRASNGELQIGVLLPVPEEERELGEKTVVDVAHELDGGRTRIARDASLQVRSASDKRLPPFVAVFVSALYTVSSRSYSYTRV
jgi:hypothetical protein